MAVNPSFSDHWGVRPILMHLGRIPIPAYTVFVLLGIMVGVAVYYRAARKEGNFSEHSFYIVFAAVLGGAVGSKLPAWIINYRAIIRSFPDLTPLLSGRTILGGMIGGSLAVTWIKRKLRITMRIGNQLAPAIAIGMFIGRIGCFFRGCCYGISTNLPWGIDFGDGLLRHPTQIYDGLFNLVLFVYLMMIRKRVAEPGRLFRIYLQWYFLARFVIEFFREEPRVVVGLTMAQLVSALALLYMKKDSIFLTFRRKAVL